MIELLVGLIVVVVLLGLMFYVGRVLGVPEPILVVIAIVVVLLLLLSAGPSIDLHSR